MNDVNFAGTVVQPSGDVDVRGDAPLLRTPGFVNAHSHAFQRALRGRVEVRSAQHADDNFWSWREAMYQDANRFTPAHMEAVATWCYRDMVEAGYTAVAEFHYVHHDGDEQHAGAFAHALVRAAQRVGIRMVLLPTAYARAGAHQPLLPTQRRFGFSSSSRFIEHVRALRMQLGAQCLVGMAVHSVRACPRAWIEDVAAAAQDDDCVLHVHACEQRQELVACANEHAGLTPVGLLHACGALTEKTTLVHATHINEHDIALMAHARSIVCLTPSTERNLGDGLAPIHAMHQASVRLCIGSDSHAVIDPLEELRSLEGHERLRTEKRNVLCAPGQRLTQSLMPMGTSHGCASLGVVADASDHVTFDMPIEGALHGAAAGVDAWMMGGTRVQRVVIGGREVVREGRCVTVDDAALRAQLQEVFRG
jgi:formimidoylglutamate deiminase